MLLTLSFTVTAQTINDTIYIKQSGAFAKVYQNDTQLKLNEFAQIIENNESASKYLQKAQLDIGATYAFIFIGGISVCYGIIRSTVYDQPSLPIVGLGFGLMLASIPLSKSYSKNLDKAIASYNSGLRKKNETGVTMRLGTTNHGFGLVVNF